MSTDCKICLKVFKNKYILDTHLLNNICKIKYTSNKELHEFISNQIIKNSQINKDCTVFNNSNIIINVNTQVPISEINFNERVRLYNLLTKYDKIKIITSRGNYGNAPECCLLLQDYIKSIICNVKNPEENSVKCVSKRPITYQIAEKRDEDGEIIIKKLGSKDSVILLTKPILKKLKNSLSKFERELIREEKKNEDSDEILEFQYGMVNDAILALTNELTPKTVERVLHNVLKHDILPKSRLNIQ